MNKEHQMLEAQVLKNNGLKQFQIAERLGVTERTVRNYLKNPPSPRKKPEKHSKLDAFQFHIDSIIANDHFYNCVLIYERIKKMGYTGKISILRRYVNMIRKRAVTEAVIRFETEPGRQVGCIGEQQTFGLRPARKLTGKSTGASRIKANPGRSMRLLWC